MAHNFHARILIPIKETDHKIFSWSDNFLKKADGMLIFQWQWMVQHAAYPQSKHLPVWEPRCKS
jgi:hypothetical protein